MIPLNLISHTARNSELRPEPFPICARRNSRMPLKQRAEKCDILISHGVTDLLHGAVIALQHSLGRGNPQFLQVDQRTVSRRLLKTAHEITYAHAYAPRWLFK